MRTEGKLLGTSFVLLLLAACGGGGGDTPVTQPPVTQPPANVAPTVQVTAPTANASFLTTDEIAVTATASDSDGSVASVALFVDAGNTPHSTDTTAPYAFSIAPGTLPAGSHGLRVVATDDKGATREVTVTVVVAEPPPSPPPLVTTDEELWITRQNAFISSRIAMLVYEMMIEAENTAIAQMQGQDPNRDCLSGGAASGSATGQFNDNDSSFGISEGDTATVTLTQCHNEGFDTITTGTVDYLVTAATGNIVDESQISDTTLTMRFPEGIEVKLGDLTYSLATTTADGITFNVYHDPSGDPSGPNRVVTINANADLLVQVNGQSYTMSGYNAGYVRSCSVERACVEGGNQVVFSGASYILTGEGWLLMGLPQIEVTTDALQADSALTNIDQAVVTVYTPTADAATSTFGVLVNGDAVQFLDSQEGFTDMGWDEFDKLEPPLP